MTKDGSNSPWAMTLLQEVVYNPCVHKDWYDLATLGGPQYVKWMDFFKEACHTRVEFNRAGDPLIPTTYPTLTGTGKGFSIGVQQAAIAALY